MSDTHTADSTERLLTGYTGRNCLLLAASWIVIMAGRYVIPPLLPNISDELALTPASAGFALTLMWISYAVVQYPGGRVSDQLTRKTVLVTSFVVMMSGFGLLFIVTTYLGFVTGVSLVGLGAGLYFTPSRALISDLFTYRRGQAISLQVSAGRAGSALAGLVSVVALAVATWRSSFLLILVPLVIALLLFHRWNHEPYVLSRVDLDLRGTGGRIFRVRQIRLVLIAYTLFAFTSNAFTSFLPTFLQLERGFSPALASLGFSLLFVLGIGSTLVAGGLGDRFSRIGVATVALVVAALGIAAVLLAPSAALILVAIALYSVGIWSYSPVMQAFLMDIFPHDSVGGDFGAMKTVYTALGSLGPTYVGLVAEQTSYGLAFVGLILCLAIGAAILLWIGVGE